MGDRVPPRSGARAHAGNVSHTSTQPGGHVPLLWPRAQRQLDQHVPTLWPRAQQTTLWRRPSRSVVAVFLFLKFLQAWLERQFHPCDACISTLERAKCQVASTSLDATHIWARADSSVAATVDV